MAATRSCRHLEYKMAMQVAVAQGLATNVCQCGWLWSHH